MTQAFEAIMLLCFGASWPFNIAKSIKSRTAKGKSVWFEVCVVAGYTFGLTGKFINGQLTYVVIVYAMDLILVTTALLLTLRNRRLDRLAEKELAVA